MTKATHLRWLLVPAAHGGEAAAATRRFAALSPEQRRSLLEFLRTR